MTVDLFLQSNNHTFIDIFISLLIYLHPSKMGSDGDSIPIRNGDVNTPLNRADEADDVSNHFLHRDIYPFFNFHRTLSRFQAVYEN